MKRLSVVVRQLTRVEKNKKEETGKKEKEITKRNFINKWWRRKLSIHLSRGDKIKRKMEKCEPMRPRK